MDISRKLRRHRRALGVIVAGVGSLALCAPGAHAATVRVGASCAPGVTTQAFSQWGDPNSYELVPGGSFTSASSGWTFTGGARVVSVTVPFDLGAGSVGALYMPPGSSATSPLMCVDASDPTYRFLALSTGGPSGGISVQADYATLLGLQVPLALNATRSPSSWGPVPAAATGAAPASALQGGTARMSLHFQSSGFSVIDDVFVDPRMHGV